MRSGVDIDGLLGNLYPAFFEWHNRRYGTRLSMDDFVTYDLTNILHVSSDDVFRRFGEFYKTEGFATVQPYPDAIEGIKELRKSADLVVITHRPKWLARDTEEWLDRHFPGMFSAVQLADYKSGRTKSKICSEVDASMMIEDAPTYAAECAVNGRKVYLMNRQWNQDTNPPNVRRVYSWKEILEDIQPRPTIYQDIVKEIMGLAT